MRVDPILAALGLAAGELGDATRVELRRAFEDYMRLAPAFSWEQFCSMSPEVREVAVDAAVALQREDAALRELAARDPLRVYAEVDGGDAAAEAFVEELADVMVARRRAAPPDQVIEIPVPGTPGSLEGAPVPDVL